MNNNSEINLSVKIIHASAGTGKTYRLTNEFVDHAEKRDFADSMRRLVAITFSEKASCEMKTRIVQSIFEKVINQLRNEEKKIECENQLFLLRISTIHSFCRSLLKRFSFLFQMDPNFSVCQPEQSYVFFRRALSVFLEKTNPDNRILNNLKPMKLKSFLDYMEELNNTHPQVFLGRPGDKKFSEPMFECFREIKKIYSEIKQQNYVMDFDDLESLAYLLICEHPEALNILNDFDQAVDFILVDEFQDTSLLQWKIIREFSREWISGRGAKAESGRDYGLFFVGDRKQSIYFFRGAENTVFDDAKKFYAPYVKNEFLTTNHRSFPEIIDFVNDVFDGQNGFPFEEKLSVSSKFSERNHGFVEIEFFDRGESIRNEKQREYEWISKKILSLIKKNFAVYDKKQDTYRPVEFGDIAVLMRKRTHLPVLEDCFRKYSIPFVNVGGIGFYQEPEIVFLISLLCVLADPSDMLSLKNVIDSIFDIDQKKIDNWRDLLKKDFASSVMDRIITELAIFSRLGSQARANVEKFLMLVHEMRDIPFFQMVQNFRRISSRTEEPKADVFSEQQNAVRVLTVHASKGLEFPVVFLTGIEQGKPDTSKIKLMHKRVDEHDADYVFVFKQDKDSFYFDYVEAMEEEEKRTLYVALTRARQGLIITGASQKSVWFELLKKFEQDYPAEQVSYQVIPVAQDIILPVRQLPLVSRKIVSPVSFSSSREIYDIFRHKIGIVIHKIIQEISNNILVPELAPVKKRTEYLLKKMKINEDAAEEIEVHIENLLKPQLKQIIIPRKNSFSELEFLAEIDGRCTYGVIDRVICENDTCMIYDFKTRHSKEILDSDIEQLKLYKQGISQLFSVRQIQTFIIFTFWGIIKSVEIQSGNV